MDPDGDHARVHDAVTAPGIPGQGMESAFARPPDTQRSKLETSRIPSRTAGLAILVLGLTAACTSAVAPSPSPAASPTPSTTPSTRATPPVALVLAAGGDVTVDITDRSGTLVEARSGTPGDGASVPSYEVVVTNVDASTLRLTWSGGPCAAQDTLSIDASGQALLLVEPDCQGDAVAFDRILDLRFSQAIDAVEVEAHLQDGVDTSS